MNKDLAIYNELRVAAERVFNEGIFAPAGVYSLAELAKVGTICKTAPKGVYFSEDYNDDDIMTLNVDGFSCNFPVSQVFRLARRFEILAKVGVKDRAVFTRETEHGEPVEDVTEGDDNTEHVAPVAPDNINQMQGTTAATPLALIL